MWFFLLTRAKWHRALKETFLPCLIPCTEHLKRKAAFGAVVSGSWLKHGNLYSRHVPLPCFCLVFFCCLFHHTHKDRGEAIWSVPLRWAVEIFDSPQSGKQIVLYSDTNMSICLSAICASRHMQLVYLLLLNCFLWWFLSQRKLRRHVCLCCEMYSQVSCRNDIDWWDAWLLESTLKLAASL